MGTTADPEAGVQIELAVTYTIVHNWPFFLSFGILFKL